MPPIIPPSSSPERSLARDLKRWLWSESSHPCAPERLIVPAFRGRLTYALRGAAVIGVAAGLVLGVPNLPLRSTTLLPVAAIVCLLTTLGPSFLAAYRVVSGALLGCLYCMVVMVALPRSQYTAFIGLAVGCFAVSYSDTSAPFKRFGVGVMILTLLPWYTFSDVSLVDSAVANAAATLGSIAVGCAISVLLVAVPLPFWATGVWELRSRLLSVSRSLRNETAALVITFTEGVVVGAGAGGQQQQQNTYSNPRQKGEPQHAVLPPAGRGTWRGDSGLTDERVTDTGRWRGQSTAAGGFADDLHSGPSPRFGYVRGNVVTAAQTGAADRTTPGSDDTFHSDDVAVAGAFSELVNAIATPPQLPTGDVATAPAATTSTDLARRNSLAVAPPLPALPAALLTPTVPIAFSRIDCTDGIIDAAPTSSAAALTLPLSSLAATTATPSVAMSGSSSIPGLSIPSTPPLPPPTAAVDTPVVAGVIAAPSAITGGVGAVHAYSHRPRRSSGLTAFTGTFFDITDLVDESAADTPVHAGAPAAILTAYTAASDVGAAATEGGRQRDRAAGGTISQLDRQRRHRALIESTQALQQHSHYSTANTNSTVGAYSGFSSSGGGGVGGGGHHGQLGRRQRASTSILDIGGSHSQ